MFGFLQNRLLRNILLKNKFLQNKTLFIQIRKYTDIMDYRIYRNRLYKNQKKIIKEYRKKKKKQFKKL